jgi:ABC-type transport system involved in cytochrome c biogenesis permease subunit
MNMCARYFPWLVVSLGATYFLVGLIPPQDKDGQMHLYEFGHLPVLEDGAEEGAGRVKPLDSLARSDLMALSRLSEFVDENDETQPAIKWLLDVMSSRVLDRRRQQERQQEKEQFIIEDPQVLAFLGLTSQPNHTYRLSELDREHFQTLIKELTRVDQLKPADRSPFENRIMEIGQQLRANFLTPEQEPDFDTTAFACKVFRIDNDQVRDLLGLQQRKGYRYSLEEFAGKKNNKMKVLFDRVKKIHEYEESTKLDLYDTKVLELYRKIGIWNQIATLESPWAVPPANEKDTWESLAKAQANAEGSGQQNPLATALDNMLAAYAKKDTKAFNKELDAYRKQVYELVPDDTSRADYEFFLNYFDPFMRCMILYGVVFILGALSWIVWPGPFGRAAFWLAALTLVVHTTTLLVRMYLQDRYFVFVTNLYSSAVFIGWGAVLVGLIIELILRNGIGVVKAAVLGFCSLFVARYLAYTKNGETMEKLQAVLDTDFWLATHVSFVTLGYMSTFVAGFLGGLILLRGVFTNTLNRDALKKLTQTLYGVVCFAMFFSFTGTVLGGIWADQSWGRFWGWDPKENGAVLVVIWNALVLHARWAGLVKQRGLAVLTIIGNMVTGWSWFGTNQLGVGLHAYGFSKELAMGLTLFWISQLIVLGIGLVPERFWRSYNAMNARPVSLTRMSTTDAKQKSKLNLKR